MKKILIFIIIFISSCSPSDESKKSNNNTSNASIESSGEIKRIIVGNKDAKITIIAFESLTCSHCANFHKDVYPQLKKDYLDTGLAKIEFRHFPLDIAAFNASKVSQCKNDGDSKILNSLFANQQKWVKGSSAEEANNNLKKFLESEGFNVDFEACINDKEIEDFVLNDRIDGVKKFEVNATPTIIINDEKFEKSLNYKNLKKALEKLI
jgi:protein-disulfide isomerase